MIVRCNFLTYDTDDYNENKIAYDDDINKAPSVLTPGAIDLAEVESIVADSDRSLNKELGQICSVGMRSGIVHVIDIPLEILLSAWVKTRDKQKVNLN
jgi:hypothetical protein